MKLSPVILSIPIYFLLIIIELVIQYFSDRKLYRLGDALSNISCGIVQQLSGFAFKVLSVGAYLLVYDHLRFTTIPSNWISWIVLFVAADFCYYWAHRISHEINLFWGGHVVHHQSEDYNFSVALRQSSFQVIWTFAFYMPLALIGFSPVDFLFASAIVTVYQFWIHTETIGKMGWFEWLFNTPSHHRVHHGRDPKYIDRNHAGVFIIWDKMFGTFQKEEEKPTYGITKPLNSFNPIWANFDHYAVMWSELKQIKKWSDKVKYLFKKPGWLPSSMGGYRPAPEVNKAAYTKYDLLVNRWLSGYLVIQYLVILGLTAFFLFQAGSFSMSDKVTVILYIIVGSVSLGGLSELKKWSWQTEIARWGFVLVSSLFASFSKIYLPLINHPYFIGWAILSFILLGLVWKKSK